jgi:hypothetical protein
MYERLIVTFTDRDPGPFADRVQLIGTIDGVIDVDIWWTFNGTVLVTVDEDDDDVIDDLAALPFVSHVNHDEIVTLDALIYEEIEVTAGIGQQRDSGRVKYYSYFREGLRPSIKAPWTTNGFDYAVPVRTERQGSGVYVAVIDSGIEPSNSEFDGRTIIALPRRGLNSIGFHGTACAQQIGGNILGMAKEVTFLDANCFGNSGSTASSNIIASMGDVADYVAANLTNGELVVANMSYSGTAAGTYEMPLFEMQALGIVCFCSSGNNGLNNKSDTFQLYPSSLLKYGSVGALDYNLQRAAFSNWGDNVFMHQIGQFVPYRGTLANAADDSVVSLISGTSFSCPYTVGCFVTWACGKRAPDSMEAVEFMQKQFLRAMGLYGYIRDRYGNLDLEDAAFMLADNSPIVSSIIVDSGGLEAVLTYSEPGTGIGGTQLEVALTYGGTMPDYLITNNPAIIGGAVDTTSGRFPSDYADHGSRFDPDQSFRISLPEDENEIWVSFYLHIGDATGNLITRPWLYLANEGGGLKAPAIGAAGDASVNLWFHRLNSNRNDEDDYSRSTVSPIPENALSRIDIFIRFNEDGNANNSTFQVYVNGVLSYDKSNFARFTTGTVLNYEHALYVGAGGSAFDGLDDPFTISNVRVSTSDTRGKDFLALRLNAVGTYNQFDLDGFTALTDLTGRKLARSQTVGQRVSGTLDFAAIPDNGAISEVKLVTAFAVDSDAANPNALAHFVRSGTTNYDQTLAAPALFRDVLITPLVNNPVDSGPWALSDLDGMQFGLLSGNV